MPGDPEILCKIDRAFDTRVLGESNRGNDNIITIARVDRRMNLGLCFRRETHREFSECLGAEIFLPELLFWESWGKVGLEENRSFFL